MTRALLPWEIDSDTWHGAHVDRLYTHVMQLAVREERWAWRAATDDDSEEGEAPTLDEAKAAAETAALPLIRALVAEHEAALVALRAVLP